MIWTEAIYCENDFVWYYAMNYNGFFSYDLNTGIIKYLDSVPNMPIRAFRKYSALAKYKDLLILLPDLENNIVVYNLKDGAIKTIKIDREAERFRFRDCYFLNGLLYSVSVSEKVVLVMDLEQEYDIKIYELNSVDKADDLAEETIVVGECIYFLCKNRNIIYQFDMRVKKTISYRVGDFSEGFYTICYDGEFFWLTGTCRQIVRWEQQTNRVVDILDFPEEFVQYWFVKDNKQWIKEKYPGQLASSLPPCYKSHCGNGYIWLIPFYSEHVLYVNTRDNSVHIFDIAEEEENNESQSIDARLLAHKYVWQYVRDGRFIIFSCKRRCLYEIDCKNKTYKKFELELDMQSVGRLLKSEFEYSGNVVVESAATNLERFLNMVSMDPKIKI